MTQAAQVLRSLDVRTGGWMRVVAVALAFALGAWGYVRHFPEDPPWWPWGVALAAGALLLAVAFAAAPRPEESSLRLWSRRGAGLAALVALWTAFRLAGEHGREVAAVATTGLGLVLFFLARWVPFSPVHVHSLLGGEGGQRPLRRRVLLAGAVALCALALAVAAAYANQTRHLAAFLLWLGSLALYAAAALCFRPSSGTDAEPPALRDGGPPLSRRAEATAVFLILAVGVALRLPLLDRVPALINSDEGRLGRYAESLWTAGFPDAFELGWNAFPNLSFLAHYVWVQVFGTSIWNLRLSAVTFGLLTLVAAHFWVRRWWGNVVAVLATLLLTINHEHVYWSRIGLNNMQQVLVAALMLGTFARALQRRGMVDWVWFGYASGLSMHVYHAAKLFPLLLAGSALLLAFGIRGLARRHAAGACVGAVGFLLMVGPQWVTIYERWDYLYANTSNRVDLYVVEDAHARGDTQAVRNYVRSHVAGTLFAFTKEPYKLAMMDPFLCVPLLLGLGWMLWAWRDPRHLVVVVWVGAIILIGGMITAYPPNNPRLIGVLPAVCAIPAVVAGRVRQLLFRCLPRRADAVVVPLLAVWVGAALYHNWRTEFVFRAGRQSRDMMTNMCRVIEETPLPATFYMAGGAGVITPRVAPIDCMLPAAAERHPIDLSDDAAIVPIRPENRGHAVLFFTAAQVELLPLVRHYYPQARYDVLNTIDGVPHLHWFMLTPQQIEQARGLAVDWGGATTPVGALVGQETLQPPPESDFPVLGRARGQVWIPAPGEYAFRAPGGSIEVNGEAVREGAALFLPSGWHTLQIAASFSEPETRLSAEWRRPGEGAWSAIPRAHLHTHPQRHGLLGRYFARELALEGSAPVEELADYTKIDAALSFDWTEEGDEPPPPAFARRPSTMEWTGTIQLPEGVTHAVRLDSSMPTRVYVDGREVVASDGGLPTEAVDASFRTGSGPAPILVRTVRAADAHGWLWKLRVLWRGPGGEWVAFADYRPAGAETGPGPR